MITLEQVDLTLDDRHILADVSFDVPAGATKVILGGSGSGKTTILRVILGLFRPEHGSVIIDGEDISKLPERQLPRIRQKMAMVFQGAALFDSLTVRENVGYRLWEQGLMPDESIELIVRQSLQFVGLEESIDNMPAALSGGMRKRVGIARALASGAAIILYDEPTAGLDPVNAYAICHLIMCLKTKGVTQVVVTHDLGLAFRIADRVVMIEQGRVVFQGAAKELSERDDRAIRGFLDPSTLPADYWNQERTPST
jgi:phospholipid/cholesterol/gamma-HCH transport system ATP-binding protein